MTELEINYPDALAMAMRAHNEVRQVRAGSGAPYWSHPASVAMRLLGHGYCGEVITAALLHDTLEDTRLTPREIRDAFGHEVLRLVDEVTNRFTKVMYPDLNYHVRSGLEAARLSNVTTPAKVIKLADILDNLSDTSGGYTISPAYARTKLALVEAISLADETLAAEARAAAMKILA